MSLLALVKSYVDKMFQSIAGMKVLLLDRETAGIISMVYSMSQILQKEVYLIERLDMARESMLHLKAVCFVRPHSETVNYLEQEFSDPKYGEYHIFFSNIIKDSYLEDLAQADIHEVVQQVQEFYADYFAVNPETFTLNIDSCISLEPSGHQRIIERICDGLVSCLLSLRRKPVIRYQRKSELCTHVQRELVRRIAHERSLFDFPQQESAPILLILDRTIDPVTPLLMQWTYQAMVHELLGLYNNRVKMPESSTKNKSNEIVLSSESDPFYSKNLFSNFGDLAINVKAALDDLQQRAKTHQNIQSIDDMKNFISNYPEYKKLSGNVSKHITLLDEMQKLIARFNLMDVSEIEQSIACQNDHSAAVKLVSDAIRNPGFSDENKVKIVLLYALRYETHSGSKLTEFIDRLFQAGVDRSLVGLISALTRYAGESARAGDLFSNKDFFASMRQTVRRGLQGATNIYTQHKPYLRELLEDLSKGRLSEQDFPGNDSLGATRMKPREVIAFFVGGATYEEALMVAEVNSDRSLGIRTILGGTWMHNSKSFLDEVAKIRDAASTRY